MVTIVGRLLTSLSTSPSGREMSGKVSSDEGTYLKADCCSRGKT